MEDRSKLKYLEIFVVLAVLASVPVSYREIFNQADGAITPYIASGCGMIASIPVAVPSVTLYSVIFTEAGLPNGTAWNVSLSNGFHSVEITGASYTFLLGDGDYSYTALANYSYYSDTDSFTVQGANLSIRLTFIKRPEYTPPVYISNNAYLNYTFSINIQATTQKFFVNYSISQVNRYNKTYDVDVVSDFAPIPSESNIVYNFSSSSTGMPILPSSLMKNITSGKISSELRDSGITSIINTTYNTPFGDVIAYEIASNVTTWYVSSSGILLYMHSSSDSIFSSTEGSTAVSGISYSVTLSKTNEYQTGALRIIHKPVNYIWYIPVGLIAALLVAVLVGYDTKLRGRHKNPKGTGLKDGSNADGSATGKDDISSLNRKKKFLKTLLDSDLITMEDYNEKISELDGK